MLIRADVRSLSGAALFATCMACGNDAAPADEDPARHACEHVGEAGTSIAATAEKSAAPLLSVSDEPYTVALPSGGASFVKLEGPLEGLLFAKTAHVVNALYQGDGMTNQLPEAAPNEFCGNEIPEHFDIGLPSVGTFYLELGPATIADVWLMLTHAHGHGGH